MNCQKCKIEIEDRDLRREFLSDAAEAHLATCAACSLFAEERLALKRLVGGLEKVSAPPDFDFRMRARLAAARSAAAQRATWFNFSPAKLSWPLAAGLALVVSVSLYFQARQPDAPAASTPSISQSNAPTAAPTVAQTNAQTNATPQLSAGTAAPQGVRNVSDENRAGIELVSTKIPRAPERTANTPSPRRVGRADVVRATVPVEESASLGLTGTTPRFVAGETRRTEGALIPVQLDAPEGQLKVLLRDTSGEARTISVDSVSFGSRDVLTRRPGATYTKASLSSNQGVW